MPTDLVPEGALALINTYAPGAQVLPPTDGGTAESCYGRFFCAPPLRGGIALNRLGGSKEYDCTSAFTARGPQGLEFVITAGHCDDASENRWAHNGITFGTLTERAEIGPADFAKIRVDRDWNISHWYYPSHDINAVQPASEDFVGQEVCISGTTTGVDCGEILGTNYSPPGFLSLKQNMIRTNYCAQPGDSGAPVYLENAPGRVAGVHSGDANQPGNQCPGPDQSYYAHASYVDNFLGVTINTTRN